MTEISRSQTALPKPVYQHQGKIKKKNLSWKIRCKCIPCNTVPVCFGSSRSGLFFWLVLFNLTGNVAQRHRVGLAPLWTSAPNIPPATLPAQHPQWRYLSMLTQTKIYSPNPNLPFPTKKKPSHHLHPFKSHKFSTKKSS